MEDQSRDLIFSLDIGTRSIIGIAGRREGDRFRVEAFEQVEHPKRAMIDGQIEDIGLVARVAGEVKARLEEKLGQRLQRVAVAAAGRALKTCNATYKTELPGTPVTPQFVFELENNAVNEARRLLDRGDDNTQYYCVGHSVVRYAIDGYPFTTLLDHSGSEAEVEIIATFLPAEVVTSLRRCMDLIDLDIDVLTLEPIAAMRAVLPADVRLLNLAMVDIGAGTADIALTRDGTVSGYTMATVAGDEITEAIIRKCLVDFETGEVIKLALEAGDEVHYTDILGHEQTMATKDILEAIEVSVEMLAKVISDRIEEANGGPPTAVFLVGGGSRTPALCGKVAEKLALDEDKVAVAGNNFSGRVLNEDAGIDSPEYATPVGIALLAADEEASGGASIEINGRRVRLYTSESTSVMDALLIAGYSYSDLMGRNGKSVTFLLNGERRVVRGGQYSVAEISLNGKPAGLTSPVGSGDKIEIVPATSGEDADPHIADFAHGAVPLAVTLNGSGVKAGLLAFLNGTPVTPETPIGEQDEVEISVIETVGDLCRSYGVSPDNPNLSRNRQPTTADTKLENGDAVSTKAEAVEGAGGGGMDASAATVAAVQPEPVPEVPQEKPPMAEPQEVVAETAVTEPEPVAETAQETPAPVTAGPENAAETPFAASASPEPVPAEPQIEEPKSAEAMEAASDAGTAGAPAEDTPQAEAPEAQDTALEASHAVATDDAVKAEATPAAGAEQAEAAPEQPEPAADPGEPEPAAETQTPDDIPPPPAAEPKITLAEDIPAAEAMEDTAAFNTGAAEPAAEAQPAVDAPPEPTPEQSEAREPAPEGPASEAENAVVEPAPETDTAAKTETPTPAKTAPEAAEPTAEAAEAEPAPKPQPTPPKPDISQPAAMPGSSLKIELNGRTVMLPPKAGGSSHFLLDMLPLVDIDPNNPKGKVLIRRNGNDAAYLDELVSGDSVEIRWENE